MAFSKKLSIDNPYVVLTYVKFCQNAFYSTLEDLNRLENSKFSIHQGLNIQVSISTWFLAIEAYINTILKFACLAENDNFGDYKKQDLGRRIAKLFKLLRYDIKYFNKTIFKNLNEFTTYRNELFHDRTNDVDLNFHCTKFSGNPMFANQVDVMQALLIGLDIFNSLRHTIKFVDLMPKILVERNNSYFYIPLDELCFNTIFPYFYDCLKKHNISTEFLSMPANLFYTESEIFLGKGIQIIIRVERESEYIHNHEKNITSFGKDNFLKYIDKVKPETTGIFAAKYNFYPASKIDLTIKNTY